MSKSKRTVVLIVEDEASIRDMMRFALTKADIDMLEADSVAQAKRVIADHIPDLILLDWMLPGQSGIEAIKWLRENRLTQDVPIIMLTAKAEEHNKVKGLETGADDYVVKPFSPLELIARIKTILRRGPLVAVDGEIRCGELVLNTHNHVVSYQNQILNLRPVEYKLLNFFMTHPERVYSRQDLLTYVWGGDVFNDERTVDVQIRRLRDVLRPHGIHTYIKTLRGSGYQWKQHE